MFRKTCCAMACLFVAACSNDGRRSATPTEPRSGPVMTWSGLWSFDEAGPAGDCLADEANASQRQFRTYSQWPIDITVERDYDGGIQLRFDYSYAAESQGFWPIEYVGTMGADGSFVAAVPASRIGERRAAPGIDFCYGAWSIEGGELTGAMSLNTLRLEGAIVETFLAGEAGGAKSFTVRSHFTASPR